MIYIYMVIDVLKDYFFLLSYIILFISILAVMY